jgi:hypothetical protein
MMSNNHYHPVTYVLALCFLIGACVPVQQTIIPATPTTSPTVEVTPTILPTSTLESQEPQDIVFSPCLSISLEPPEGNQLPWLLLVNRPAIYYSFDPNSGLIVDELIAPPYPGSNSSLPYDFSLSPDGKWIAYVLSDEYDDLVVEPSGNLLTKSAEGRMIWRPKNIFQLQGWLSNESIIVTMYRSQDSFGSTLIRNPFTEEEHEFFLEEMPDYLNYQPGG